MQSLIFAFLLLIITEGERSVKADNHAIYLSVCEIDHRNEGENASINIKVFETDIRDAFRNMFSMDVDFSKKASSTYKKESEQYFNKYLKIQIDGEKGKLAFRSLELNGDSVWFYFNMDCPEKWESISVTADYLMELFPDQSNVISIYHGSDKRFLRITRAKKTLETNFRD